MIDRRRAERAISAHYTAFAAAIYGAQAVTLAGGRARALHQAALREATWNHAALRPDLSELDLNLALRAARSFYRRRGQTAAVATHDPSMATSLAARDYEPAFRHAWLFATDADTGVGDSPVPPVALPDNAIVTTSHGAADLAAFLEIFAAAFGSTEYRTAFSEALTAPVGGVTVEHHVLWLDDRPAACGTVARSAGVAGLYNLGVHPEFQRRGLGSALTSWRRANARAYGCDLVFLQTEDVGVEALQRRAGWVPGVEVWGYWLRD